VIVLVGRLDSFSDAEIERMPYGSISNSNVALICEIPLGEGAKLSNSSYPKKWLSIANGLYFSKYFDANGLLIVFLGCNKFDETNINQ
jgi:hypothetical protein